MKNYHIKNIIQLTSLFLLFLSLISCSTVKKEICKCDDFDPTKDSIVLKCKCQTLDSLVNTKNKEYSPVLTDDYLYYTKSMLDTTPQEREREAFVFMVNWEHGCALVNSGCCENKYQFDKVWICKKPFKFGKSENLNLQGGIAINNGTLYYSSFDRSNSEQLDLYSIDINKPGQVNELSILNSNKWESQPTLSNNGNLIMFASNRSNESIPNDNIDLWYSFKIGNEWQTPQLVPFINSESNEESPCVVNDSLLLYSTDKDGDYDIKAVKFNISLEGDKPKLSIDSKSVEDANTFFNTEINHKNSNEKYPFLSNQYSTLFYCSDSGKEKFDYDIKTKAVSQKGITKITVSVIRLEYDDSHKLLDSNSGIIPIKLKYLETNCNKDVEDLQMTTGSSYILEPDSKAIIYFDYEPNPDTCIYSEEITIKRVIDSNGTKEETTLPAKTKSDYLSIDCRNKEIKYIVVIERTKHNIITTQLKSKLDWFIIGYWRPSLSQNELIYYKEKASGTFYRTSVSKIFPKQEKVDSLDAAFNEVINSIKPMVDKAAECNLFLKLKIFGFTDPLRLKGKKIYNGNSFNIGFDISGNPYKIQQHHPNLHEVELPGYGQNGNVVLSKLRAYYTFDALKEQLTGYPNWDELMSENRVLVDIEGFGIVDSDTDHYNGNPGSRKSQISATFGTREEMIDPYCFDTKSNSPIMENDKKNVVCFRKLRLALPLSFELPTDTQITDEEFYLQIYNDTSNKSNYIIRFRNSYGIQKMDKLVNDLQKNGLSKTDTSNLHAYDFIRYSDAKLKAKEIEQNIMNNIELLKKNQYSVIDTNAYYAVSYFIATREKKVKKIKDLLDSLGIKDLIIAKYTDSKKVYYRLRTNINKDRKIIEGQYGRDRQIINKYGQLLDLQVIELKDKES